MNQKLSLEERLSERHPELLKRFEEIMALVENVEGEIQLADEAEERAIREVRLLGNEIMHSWARQQNQRTSKDFAEKMTYVRKSGKKKFIGIPPLEILK